MSPGFEQNGSLRVTLQSGRMMSEPTQVCDSVRHHASSVLFAGISRKTKGEWDHSRHIQRRQAGYVHTIDKSTRDGIRGHELAIDDNVLVGAGIENVEIPRCRCLRAISCTICCYIIVFPPVAIERADHLEEGLVTVW